jgi:hypothetical protein
MPRDGAAKHYSILARTSVPVHGRLRLGVAHRLVKGDVIILVRKVVRRVRTPAGGARATLPRSRRKVAGDGRRRQAQQVHTLCAQGVSSGDEIELLTAGPK